MSLNSLKVKIEELEKRENHSDVLMLNKTETVACTCWNKNVKLCTDTLFLTRRILLMVSKL